MHLMRIILWRITRQSTKCMRGTIRFVNEVPNPMFPVPETYAIFANIVYRNLWKIRHQRFGILQPVVWIAGNPDLGYVLHKLPLWVHCDFEKPSKFQLAIGFQIGY